MGKFTPSLQILKEYKRRDYECIFLLLFLLSPSIQLHLSQRNTHVSTLKTIVLLLFPSVPFFFVSYTHNQTQTTMSCLHTMESKLIPTVASVTHEHRTCTERVYEYLQRYVEYLKDHKSRNQLRAEYQTVSLSSNEIVLIQ